MRRRSAPVISTALVSLTLAVLGGCGSGPSEGAGSTAAQRWESPSTARSSTTTAESVSPSTTTTTTTAPPPTPPYEAAILPVTAADLGASWHPGCPVGPEQLRAVDLSFLGVDGAVHSGRVVVATELAQPIADVFGELYAAGFPLARVDPIDVFDGDDNRSISANNTSAFNCRLSTGGSSWSEHAYGRAIDINPLVNPYVRGSTVLPPEAAPYADRARRDPGMIHAGDVVVRSLAARGWQWGGDWSSLKDYQHFSTTGR